jgi:hypothetical protein
MTYVRTEKIGTKYKFIHGRTCDICNSYYETFKGNKKSITAKNNWCSLKCRQTYFKQTAYKTLECKFCNNTVNVYKSNIFKFCSHKCYTEYAKLHPTEFGLDIRANNMRKYTNTPESIAKGIQTKKDNGYIQQWADERNIEWKKYWKVCNYHTRQMRKVMLKTWDGYDYIDGEYIKDNLSLHYSDKNYPSLDHIKPRSKCFEEGMTVRECCNPTNLAWTKRINNSRKYNKQR